MKRFWLFLYYGFAQHLPSQPMPGWTIGYLARRFLARRLFQECGEGVIVKTRAYFGTGGSLRIGNRAVIGIHSRIDNFVTLGDDVMMGPDVVIMTSAHSFEDPTMPINRQPPAKIRPVRIGRDVWIGTRVVIMPGVTIGEGSVIGAGCIIRTNIPPFSVVVGESPRIMWKRGQLLKKAQTSHAIQAER